MFDSILVRLLDPVLIISGWLFSYTGFILATNVFNQVLNAIFFPMPTFFDLGIICGYLYRKERRDKFMYLILAAFILIFIADIFVSYSYERRILFILAMWGLALAQILLIIAFSINGQSLHFTRLILVVAIITTGLSFQYSNCNLANSTALAAGATIYTILAGLMCWRALARVGFSPADESVVAQWFLAIGAVLFLCGDILLISHYACTLYGEASHTGFLTLRFVGLFAIALGSDRFASPADYFYPHVPNYVVIADT